MLDDRQGQPIELCKGTAIRRGTRGASVLHRVQDLLHLLRELVHDDRLVADDLRQVRLVHEVAVAGVDRGRSAVLEVDLARALGLVPEVRRRAPRLCVLPPLRHRRVFSTTPRKSTGQEPSGSFGSFGPTDLAQLKPGIILCRK